MKTHRLGEAGRERVADRVECRMDEEGRHRQMPPVFRLECVADICIGIHVPAARPEEPCAFKCRGIGVLVSLCQNTRVALDVRDPAAPRAHERETGGLPDVRCVAGCEDCPHCGAHAFFEYRNGRGEVLLVGEL